MKQEALLLEKNKKVSKDLKDDLLGQIMRSLEDLKHGRVREWK